jgi:hypothetical protein
LTSAAALMLLVQLATMTVLPDGLAGDLLFGLSIALVPIAAGVAILRHRLYDIDRLINRTLVYGVLTAVLGAVYAGLVLALGLLGGVGGELPSWAVAAATLTVATLFQPLRRRVQAAVDRRFNRRRYDATRTVEAFSARLRDQVDLDTLAAELLAGVEQTVEPTTVSLWLRPGLDDGLDLDREPERQCGHPHGRAGVATPVAEQLQQQGRGAVDHRRHRPEPGHAGHEPGDLDHPDHLLEGAEGGTGLGEQVEGAVAGRRPALLDGQLQAEPSGPAVRSLPGQEQQVARADPALVQPGLGPRGWEL